MGSTALDALAREWPFRKLVEWPSGDRNETVGEPVCSVEKRSPPFRAAVARA